MPREGLFLTYINMQPTGPRDNTTMVTPFLAPLIILYGSGAGKWRPEQGKEKSEVRRLALQKQAAATVSAYPMTGWTVAFGHGLSVPGVIPRDSATRRAPPCSENRKAAPADSPTGRQAPRDSD
jgi:hypothetical protein